MFVAYYILQTPVNKMRIKQYNTVCLRPSQLNDLRYWPNKRRQITVCDFSFKPNRRTYGDRTQQKHRAKYGRLNRKRTSFYFQFSLLPCWTNHSVFNVRILEVFPLLLIFDMICIQTLCFANKIFKFILNLGQLLCFPCLDKGGREDPGNEVEKMVCFVFRKSA